LVFNEYYLNEVSDNNRFINYLKNTDNIFFYNNQPQSGMGLLINSVIGLSSLLNKEKIFTIVLNELPNSPDEGLLLDNREVMLFFEALLLFGDNDTDIRKFYDELTSNKSDCIVTIDGKILLPIESFEIKDIFSNELKTKIFLNEAVHLDWGDLEDYFNDIFISNDERWRLEKKSCKPLFDNVSMKNENDYYCNNNFNIITAKNEILRAYSMYHFS
jgi:hypothetical protein